MYANASRSPDYNNRRQRRRLKPICESRAINPASLDVNNRREDGEQMKNFCSRVHCTLKVTYAKNLMNGAIIIAEH